MANNETMIRGITGSRRGFAAMAVSLFAFAIALIVWQVESKVAARRDALHDLADRQALQVSQVALSGRIVADLVFGELRRAFKAADLPSGAGIGNLRQEGDYYEYLYGRPGAAQDVDRLMTGNLVGLLPAKTDLQLARLQKVLQHLYERDLSILGQKWSSRVAYTYWMSKDQAYAFSVPRWDFAAAIANSPQKTAKSAMGELAGAMLTPYVKQIKAGEIQIFRTDAWVDSTDGRALQTMVSPMFDARGEWIGNAAVDFGLEEVDQMLDDSGQTAAQWLLVTQRGTVLARHVDKQGALAKLAWGQALSETPIPLPEARDGAEMLSGDYRVRVAAVPGSDLHLYLLMPAEWIYQDVLQMLAISSGGLLLLALGLAIARHYQLRREQETLAEIQRVEALTQQEAGRHERSLQLKAWAGRLANALQHADEDAAGFGHAALTELAPELRAGVAAFFVRATGDDVFHCVAGYNIAPERCLSFKANEGMGGAAVQAQEIVVCRDIPSGYLGMAGGTLAVDPREIAVIPVAAGGDVRAVIEVGYLESPGEQEAILAEALPVIAFSLELMLGKQATLEDLKLRAEIEERQRLVLGSMTDGIFGQDSDGRVTFINPAAERMLGFEPGELLGQPMHRLTHHHRADGSEFPREESSMYLTSLDGKARTVSDEIFWRKDGSFFHIEYTTTPLAKDGQIQGAVISFRDTTERRRAEEKANAYFQSSSDGLLILAPGNGFVHANYAAVRLFGFEHIDDLLKCGPVDLSPETQPDGRNSAAAAMEYIQQAMQSTAVVSFEWLHKRRDATLVPCEVTLTRISVGNEEQLLVCVRDITERQKHQHEVERLLKEQQALFDAAPVGIFYTGDGTIVRANRQMGLLYGWPDGSAVGRRSAEIHTSEESLKAFGALVGAQLAKGEAVSEAWPQRRADGSEFMAQISGQAISMEGYQIASVWTIEDITERRQAEARLRDQFAFQQALVDTIPYPVFYKGADSRFLGANRAYEDTFGIRREDIIGKRALDLDYLPEADREAYQKEDEEIIANSGTVQKELSMSFADGRIHDTLYYVAGFRREDGSPGGLVGTFIDVSDRKKVEDLERFNRLALGREQRIVELKREINALAAEFGRGAPYAAPDEVEAAGPQEEAASAVGTADAAAMIKQEFAELVQREQLKELFDGFCASVGIAAAIIDLDANVLASSRWQRVCTDFHRVNAKSCANCIESDTGLASKLEEGRDFTMYRCKNGMTDCAAPIVIDGHHVANVFIGQFHLQKPDPVFFRKQAAEFGFDADRYVAAVEEAPVMAEDKLPHILGFLARFARLIGAFAIGQRHALLAEQQSAALAVTAWNERVAALSLAEDADKARQELLVYQEQLEKIFVERTARLEQIDRAAQADPEGGGSA